MARTLLILGVLIAALLTSQITQYPGPSATPLVVREVPTGTLNGVNQTFSLSFTPKPDASLLLFINGIAETPVTEYTISGGVITYINAPAATDRMMAWYLH